MGAGLLAFVIAAVGSKVVTMLDLFANTGSMIVLAIWLVLAFKFGWRRAFAVFVMFPPLLVAMDMGMSGTTMLEAVTLSGGHGQFEPQTIATSTNMLFGAMFILGALMWAKGGKDA